MPKIQIDITEMEEALTQMSADVREFKTISQSAFADEINSLGQMYSDFAVLYARILSCMENWGTVGLAENMETYCKDAKAILDAMVATDEAESNAIREIAGGRA